LGVKLALKGAEAHQKRRRETCGRERVKFADDFTLQKDKALPNRKAVNLIRPREAIKTPLLAGKIYAPKRKFARKFGSQAPNLNSLHLNHLPSRAFKFSL
jgi:hypothetical protein